MPGRRWKMYTGFYLVNVKGRNHWVFPGIDRRIILKWILRNRVWIGFIWPRIWSGGRLL
jgi:hypothetical protein